MSDTFSKVKFIGWVRHITRGSAVNLAVAVITVVRNHAEVVEHEHLWLVTGASEVGAGECQGEERPREVRRVRLSTPICTDPLLNDRVPIIWAFGKRVFAEKTEVASDLCLY